MTAVVPLIGRDGGVPAGIAHDHLPALVVAAGECASIRFLEFFASTIRNPHTRRACARRVRLPGMVPGS